MRVNLTLTKIPRRERNKFRTLSRPETYREIRKGGVGERVAYGVDMTEAELRRAQRDAEDPQSNLVAVDRVYERYDNGVPGTTVLDYMAARGPANNGWNGSGVDVGIIEGGYGNSLTTFLAGRVKASKGFGTITYEDGSTAPVDPSDPGSGHGKSMASVAIPPRARIAAAAYDYTSETMGQAMYWLVDEVGVDVINISQGGLGYTTVEADAFVNARAKNVLVFAAAGNGGTDEAGDGNYMAEYYPAAYPGVLAITNYRPSTDAINSTSNWGPYVWAAAGGCEIYMIGGTDNQEQYHDSAGTSAACAVTSRITAMLMTKIKSPGTVRKYLANNARRTGASSLYEGSGVLQLSAAINAIRQDRPKGENADGSETKKTNPGGTESPVTEGCTI